MRSYKYLVDGLVNEYDLYKEEFISHLQKAIPELRPELKGRNITYNMIYDILRTHDVGIHHIESELRKYFQSVYYGIIQEDWIIEPLKNWLKIKMEEDTSLSEVRVFDKVNVKYPDEYEGVELDIVGVGSRKRAYNGEYYKMYGIEAKRSFKSFFRKARQILGYPLFVEVLYFAAYFNPGEDYSRQHKAYAREREINLLKETSTRKPTSRTKYIIEEVSKQGGKNVSSLVNEFGDAIWDEENPKTIYL